MSTLGFPLFPEQASTMAPRVDLLYFFLLGVSVFFATLILILIVAFAVKYRRRSDDEQPRPISGNLGLEILWTVVPLSLTLVMFVWGARLFFITFYPPTDALEINVVAKQWMWKVQHAEGRSEIDELHIPTGRPVKLIMTSQDVIHDFFVPAFRVKNDVLPGRYTTLWFEATKPGAYRLFCSQYCGTQHSGMIGHIIALEPAEFQTWLSGGADGGIDGDGGRESFPKTGLCHLPRGKRYGPRPVVGGAARQDRASAKRQLR